MENQAIKDANEIVKQIKNGDWKELIRLQTMENRDSYHGEVVNNVLFLLRDDKFSTTVLPEKSVYLVSLTRYFGIKDLNGGHYLREEKDGREFVKQYKEMMKNNSELQKEDGEKIRILEVKLILDEEVL